MANRQREESRTRNLIAQECARIMVSEGVRDFRLAKRKAVARLGFSERVVLPGNAEIEQAILDYQRLFKAAEQPLQLRILREAAVEAMRFLARFRPRLVGSVLAGTAGPHADVNLHLFADTTEEVALFLMEHAIPFETSERRVRLGHGEYVPVPVFGFGAGGVNVDLTVFDLPAEREAPRSPIDGRPMHRAGLAEVQALLETETIPLLR
jgi:hypothetical protein